VRCAFRKAAGLPLSDPLLPLVTGSYVAHITREVRIARPDG
jgi:hypothetical protein